MSEKISLDSSVILVVFSGKVILLYCRIFVVLFYVIVVYLYRTILYTTTLWKR